MKWKIFR